MGSRYYVFGSAATGAGSGTVTSFGFTNGGGFTGTVTNSTTTPNLSLTGAFMADLVRTAVKTANYTAAPSDLVPCDSTAGGFTVTLPTTPADLTLIEVKHIIQGTTSGTGNSITIATGGADVINRAGGPTSVTLPLLGESRAFLYQASTAIWTVVWAELPQESGSAPTRVTARSTTYTALASDIVLCTAGAGGFTVTLPASTINSQVIVKKVDAGAGTITISPTSGTIDGAATDTITTRYVSNTYVADGTNWNKV